MKKEYERSLCISTAVIVVILFALVFLIGYCIQLKKDFDALHDFCEYQQSYIVELEDLCDSYESAK